MAVGNPSEPKSVECLFVFEKNSNLWPKSPFVPIGSSNCDKKVPKTSLNTNRLRVLSQTIKLKNM